MIPPRYILEAAQAHAEYGRLLATFAIAGKPAPSLEVLREEERLTPKSLLTVIREHRAALR